MLHQFALSCVCDADLLTTLYFFVASIIIGILAGLILAKVRRKTVIIIGALLIISVGLFLFSADVVTAQIIDPNTWLDGCQCPDVSVIDALRSERTGYMYLVVVTPVVALLSFGLAKLAQRFANNKNRY